VVRIRLMVQSAPKAHQLLTENLSEEEADRLLDEEIAAKLGTAGIIRLPGVVVPASNVLSAEKAHPARAGGQALRLA
jgi:hypothetical protein